ncbi:ABC transporter substrate-binding protein [Streptomyces sp. NPDC091292]|uniref:ABC transporter substrate-binding protein n=1 Tax=Streptomyces sp. NPDC091292 TaxID=3365991 RepID=UPI003808E277
MSHDGLRLRSVMRSVAFLTTGVLTVTTLAACSSGDESGTPAAGQDIAPTARDQVSDGGTLNWAVDSVPETLNTFQADADATTSRIAGAVLPSMFRLDAQGRPQRNADFLESAKVVTREPRQVVLYKLNQQAVWSDGREIGADDFTAQWRALSGKDNAYWTARNAGYDRIEKIERGANNLEVRVTFAKPYADWRSLFSPLYPKDVMGTPDHFNDGARDKLKVSAGPFALQKIDKDGGEVTLQRSARWWGAPAKLDKVVLRDVPRNKRAAALADGKVDLADIDPSEAQRVALADRDHGGQGALTHGPGAAITPAQALRSWAVAYGSDEEAADEEVTARRKTRKAIARYADEQAGLRQYVVRKSLEPAYTQLALNGAEGPLADERVRRAVARAIDRQELARVVLKPLGLPVKPVGSHLALSGQEAYADGSGALGGQDTAEAQALLTDAGWIKGGPIKEEKKPKTAGSESEEGDTTDEKSSGSDEGTYIVGQTDQKPASRTEPSRTERQRTEPRHTEPKHDAAPPADDAKGFYRSTSVLAPASAPYAARQQIALLRQAVTVATLDDSDVGKKEARAKQQGGAQGAYAPKGTAAPPSGSPAPQGAGAPAGPLAKDGKPLTLRFVLPSGPGSESLRAVGDRISQMLERIGIRTEVSKVADDSYFKDHVASGQYDMALYSWPASAYPATDARPIYAKPVPAADGSLNVEQNYTRVGTDHIDQLFNQAMGELNEETARDLVRKADSRIWAAAGSIPLYQRPQLVAVKPNLVNAGAFGFETPRYENIGFKKANAHPGGKGEKGEKGEKK